MRTWQRHGRQAAAPVIVHPGDFTPMCTTELGEFARRKNDFRDRDAAIIGASVDTAESHRAWPATTPR